MNYCFYF